MVTKFGGVDGVDFGGPTQVGVGQSEVFSVDTFNNTIAGYDVETGERRWQVTDVEVDSTGEVSFIVVDGIVVATDETSVFGIDPEAEEVSFRLDVETFDNGLAGSDARAFFVNLADPASVQAVDVGQGETDWDQDVRVSGSTAPALAGNRLLVATRDSVTLLDPSSGDII